MTKRHKTSDEWRKELRGRLSPRLANRELFDMLWEDMPYIFEDLAAAKAVLAKGVRVHASQEAGVWWADESNLHLGINATLVLDNPEKAKE